LRQWVRMMGLLSFMDDDGKEKRNSMPKVLRMYLEVESDKSREKIV
jgi:hypothetical protein